MEGETIPGSYFYSRAEDIRDRLPAMDTVELLCHHQVDRFRFRICHRQSRRPARVQSLDNYQRRLKREPFPVARPGTSKRGAGDGAHFDDSGPSGGQPLSSLSELSRRGRQLQRCSLSWPPQA